MKQGCMHVNRVSGYCHALALAHGLTADFAEQIQQASPMHDVGKIGIPDMILLKPGKLNDDEFEIMKTHTTIGAKILKGSKFDLMKMAYDIALGHQEKWDGSGYPSGLSGEDIPISARIVAIVDVYDALLSKRPYKDKWPVKKIINIINEQSGTHFDPSLVETFNRIVPKFLEISEKYEG